MHGAKISTTHRYIYPLHLDNLQQQPRVGISVAIMSTLVMTASAACSLTLEDIFLRALGNVASQLVQGEPHLVHWEGVADCFEGLQNCCFLEILSYRWS